MVEIKRCTVQDIIDSPNYARLLDEYAEECSLHELGKINPQIETYRKLEELGNMIPIGAYFNGSLHGFALPVISVVPHYGVKAAVVESIFVSKDVRYLFGIRLMQYIKDVCRDAGAVALAFSAPVGSDFAKFLSMPTSGYRQTNVVHACSL